MTAERQCRDCQRAAIRGFTVCNDHLTRLLSAAFGPPVEPKRERYVRAADRERQP